MMFHGARDMVRGEITGKKLAQTADQAERLPGPSSADSSAIEPTIKGEPDVPAKAKGTPIRGPPVPAAWYSIKDFCAAHRISQAMYFKLKADKRGPREIAVGSRRYVTFEDAATWRAAQKEAVAA
jgi:hypothetical protein